MSAAEESVCVRVCVRVRARTMGCDDFCFGEAGCDAQECRALCGLGGNLAIPASEWMLMS